jgi:hypothetical protein
VQAAADAFGEVDLHMPVSHASMAHRVRAGEQAVIACPRVALHAVTSHAIERGALALPRGRVTVAWRIAPADPEPALALDWKESGGSGVREPERRGFGTEVVEAMLPCDLDAQVVPAYEPDGLRCTIRFPLAPGVGRVLADAEPVAVSWDGRSR